MSSSRLRGCGFVDRSMEPLDLSMKERFREKIEELDLEEQKMVKII